MCSQTCFVPLGREDRSTIHDVNQINPYFWRKYCSIRLTSWSDNLLSNTITRRTPIGLFAWVRGRRTDGHRAAEYIVLAVKVPVDQTPSARERSVIVPIYRKLPLVLVARLRPFVTIRCDKIFHRIHRDARQPVYAPGPRSSSVNPVLIWTVIPRNVKKRVVVPVRHPCPKWEMMRRSFLPVINLKRRYNRGTNRFANRA
jgi:hypothetical protein